MTTKLQTTSGTVVRSSDLLALMKLQRKLTQWIECSPEKMSKMSPAAIEYALADARLDILTMAKLLCEAGYPRRGTPEEFQSIYDFAAKVQTLIPHSHAVELR